jgi:hypothetical protein
LNDKPKYKLEDLIAEMPAGLPIHKEWDTIPPVGKEWGAKEESSVSNRLSEAGSSSDQAENKLLG